MVLTNIVLPLASSLHLQNTRFHYFRLKNAFFQFDLFHWYAKVIIKLWLWARISLNNTNFVLLVVFLRHCYCVTPFCRDEKKMHSFVKKRVHLSEKTTCCFYENDGLFLVKRRVVLWQTTCRFFSAVWALGFSSLSRGSSSSSSSSPIALARATSWRAKKGLWPSTL